MKDKKLMKKAIKLSIDNETIRDPGEPFFQYPKEKSGKDKIFTGSISRGHTGSKEHPRG